jgi:hypothetical protein
MKTLQRLLLIFALAVGVDVWAQRASAPSAPGQKKQLISVSAMALTSSTQQGGQGPSGSTVLSQSEYVYALPNFGLGFFFLYDMQGSAEKDSAYGPKLELYLEPFFLEFGYIVTAKRAYTDRTIADQTGDGMFYGLGARFNLGAAGGKGASGWFFQASYKFRTFNIKKQDGSQLDEPIKQADGYPLIGIGYQF